MRRAACRRGLLVPCRAHHRGCWPAGPRAPALGGPRGGNGLRKGRHKPSAVCAALALRWREARADAQLPRAEARSRARRRSDSLRNAAASTERSGPEGAPERRCGTPPRAHTKICIAHSVCCTALKHRRVRGARNERMRTSAPCVVTTGGAAARRRAPAPAPPAPRRPHRRPLRLGCAPRPRWSTSFRAAPQTASQPARADVSRCRADACARSHARHALRHVTHRALEVQALVALFAVLAALRRNLRRKRQQQNSVRRGQTAVRRLRTRQARQTSACETNFRDQSTQSKAEATALT